MDGLPLRHYNLFKLELSDPPSAPGLPEIIDWAENMVKLKWEPPIRDGGAPITGYIIEMKDKFGTTFVKAAEVEGRVCTGTVTRLEEGNQYQFRVRAVNKAGPGEPSEATNPHTAKARWREYNDFSFSSRVCWKNCISC